MRNKKC